MRQAGARIQRVKMNGVSKRDQPPPERNDGRSVWDLVVSDVRGARERDADGHFSTFNAPLVEMVLADMAERDQVGRERYGTPLQAHNGRDALVDAYQEYLDGSAYLRQAAEESTPGAAELYRESLRMVFELRLSIFRNRGK
jgi:hypothetical protein